MKEENIGVLSAGERFGFKGFEWIVLGNNAYGSGGVAPACVFNPKNLKLHRQVQMVEA